MHHESRRQHLQVVAPTFTLSAPNCCTACASVSPQVPMGGCENTTVGTLS
jgi:hypothetical protein